MQVTRFRVRESSGLAEPHEGHGKAQQKSHRCALPSAGRGGQSPAIAGAKEWLPPGSVSCERSGKPGAVWACLVGRADFALPVALTAWPERNEVRVMFCRRLVPCISFLFIAYLFCIFVFGVLQT